MFLKGKDNKFHDVVCCEEIVKNKLNGLKCDESPGVDSIGTNVLKDFYDQISLDLAVILNNSLKSDIVPSIGKL